MSTTSNPNVMMFCPVRQDAETLALVLESHRELKGITSRWYRNENRDLAARDLLWSDPGADIVAGIPSPYSNHEWTAGLMSHMSEVRDEALADFLDSDADYLLMVDADVVLPPDTALSLVAASKGSAIVSAVYWSQWPGSDVWLPNVWDSHNYSFDNAESLVRLRDPGVYTVGGLGAVTLIPRQAAIDGARYTLIPGLGYPGEDRHFATRAAALGIALLADTSVRPYHVYRTTQLADARAWWTAGAPRAWFDSWLGGAWEAAAVAMCAPKPATRIIALCMPGDRFDAPYLWAFWDIVTGSVQHGFGIVPVFGFCSNVYITRAMLAEQAKQIAGAEIVVWIDDDNVVRWEDIERLIAVLDAHPAAAAAFGWCWIDGGPENPDLRCSVGEWRNNRFCSIEPPAGGAPYRLGADQAPGVSGFPVVAMRNAGLHFANGFAPRVGPQYKFGLTGEDISWCLSAQENGFEVWCDPAVEVPHIKPKPVDLQRKVQQKEF